MPKLNYNVLGQSQYHVCLHKAHIVLYQWSPGSGPSLKKIGLAHLRYHSEQKDGCMHTWADIILRPPTLYENWWGMMDYSPNAMDIKKK